MRSRSNKKLADNNNKVFRNEAARRTYHKLRFFTVYEGSETFILFIAQLDALVAMIVNLLNINQSIRAGGVHIATVYTDQVAGTMTGEEGTVTKSEQRPKSRRGRKV